ncbi:Ig-like domain-containing protein [Lysobacter sp. CA199]|uniref:Ig-like domain-containing protein n=1 Tax=Lysobacter sp. CA199 TaxID=3455608 RepID=UPI003F8D460B
MAIDIRFYGPLLRCAVALAGTAFTVTPAWAALDDVGHAPPSTHRLKFLVDSQLSAGTTSAEIGRRLNQYVADLNTVFVRESVRSFVFDPITDLAFVDPAGDARCKAGPVNTVAGTIEVCIAKSAQNYSYGGYAGSVTNPQAGSVRGMNWLNIYDPLRLSKTVVAPSIVASEEDYLVRQLRTLVHELEHVFGAGMGEYYNLASGTDRSGVPPTQNLALSNRNDRYWWSRQHWKRDPLLSPIYGYYGPAKDRVAMLEMTRFTAGTKAQLNTDWSQWPYASTYVMPMTTATEVWVTDPISNTPVAGAQVTVWQVPQPTAAAAKQVAQGNTDSVGRFVFDWKCNPSCFNNYSGILLVKATAPQRDPAATWFSIFDAFEQKAAFGQNAITIDLPMPVAGADTQAPNISISAPARATLGQPLTISATASDNTGIQGIKLLAPGDWGCTLVAPPYACTFVPVLAGAQDVTAIAMDLAGNLSQTQARIVFDPPGDAIAPLATVTAPASAPVNTVVPILATASDNLAVIGVDVIVDGRRVCSLTATPYRCDWTPSKPGYANIEVRASDAAGNAHSVSTTTRVQ